jgi:hypothetical protein
LYTLDIMGLKVIPKTGSPALDERIERSFRTHGNHLGNLNDAIIHISLWNAVFLQKFIGYSRKFPHI